MKDLRGAMHLTTFQRTVDGLLVAWVMMKQNESVLHAFPVFVPPLESTLNQEQAVRRARAYVESGIDVVRQMYMSTTRGLLA